MLSKIIDATVKVIDTLKLFKIKVPSIDVGMMMVKDVIILEGKVILWFTPHRLH